MFSCCLLSLIQLKNSSQIYFSSLNFVTYFCIPIIIKCLISIILYLFCLDFSKNLILKKKKEMLINQPTNQTF